MNLPRVLLIDDSTSICSFVADLLNSAGYEVLTAEDGRKGLDAIAGFKPDAILLDVEMPGISGLEVLAELNHSVHCFSIIMFTSLSSLPQIVEALRQGADDYITKPFQNDELLARLEAAIRSARLKVQLLEAKQSAEDSLACLKVAQERLVEEEKIASVARLAAGVAHNINNPLGFILSNLASLDRYSKSILVHADALSQRLRNYGREESTLIDEMERKHHIRQIRGDLKPLLDETREGFERIALIVKRLSRLELGLSQQVHTMPFNLVPSLEALIRSLPSSLHKQISFEWKSEVDDLPVNGAITLLNAAIEELLTNAVEAIDGDGTVDVTVGREGSLALISIRDTGKGIPEERLLEIFEPFYTSKSQITHVGLGLTIAERFLDLIGGKIRIESEDCVGTTVSVQIPIID